MINHCYIKQIDEMIRHTMIRFSIINNRKMAFQTALQYFLTQNETKTDEKSSKANKKSRAKLTPHDYLRCLKLTVFPE